MDPSEDFSPTFTPQASVMSSEEEEESSPEDSGDSQPVSSETLVKDLRNLNLNPGTKLPSPPPEDASPPRDRGDSTRSEKALWEIRGGYPYRRRGVRTVLSVRRERMAKLRYLLSLTRPRAKREQTDTDPDGEQSESRSVPFKCTCSFCVQHGWDPSENAKIGSDFTASV